jgi:antitoxin component YwqK of YwqJK toxin-antitoxin module
MERKKIKQTHPDGTKEEYELNEFGQIDGLSKWWYSNGNDWEQFTYQNGKLHGLYKNWWENGNIATECTFQNDEIDGWAFLYSNNNQIERVSFYKQGEVIYSFKRKINTNGKEN